MSVTYWEVFNPKVCQSALFSGSQIHFSWRVDVFEQLICGKKVMEAQCQKLKKKIKNSQLVFALQNHAIFSSPKVGHMKVSLFLSSQVVTWLWWRALCLPIAMCRAPSWQSTSQDPHSAGAHPIQAPMLVVALITSAHRLGNAQCVCAWR